MKIIKSHPVIDFHGPSQNCGERLRTLTLQNKATCVKALDAGGWAFEAAKVRRDSGVPHIIIFRQTAPGDLANDHPDLNQTPRVAAEKLWCEILKTMPKELISFKDIIYIEPTNEPGVVTAPDMQEQAKWIGQFCVEIASIMLEEGWNPALAGFNAGTPSQEQVRDYFVDLLRLFEANWDRCLWTLHEAKLGGFKPGLDFKSKGLQLFVPDLISSSQRVFAVCDELGIRRPRTFISEFAWSHNDIPGKDQFRTEVQEVCRLDAQWPEVVGRVIYTTHAGGPMWGGLRNKLNGNGSWLTEYVTNTILTVEAAAPAPVRTAPGGGPLDEDIPLDDAAEAAGFSSSIELVNVAHPPGTTYQATWTFRNSGQTTWNGGYKIAFSEEAHPQSAAHENLPLGSKQAFAISEVGATNGVKPGKNASLTLDITLPASPGKYATNWQLQAPDGRRFGPVRWTAAQVSGVLDYELVHFQNSVADFENMQPGRQFSGIWTLRNNGAVAWPGDTRLLFVNGHRAETEGRILSTMGAEPNTTLRELTGRESIAAGEEVTLTLNFVAPHQPGKYAFNWQLRSPQGDPFGGLRWIGAGVVGVDPGPDDHKQPGGLDQSTLGRFGMNVNINGGHALDVERMRGLSWVRYVYWGSRRNETPEEAFANKYRNVIQSYAAAGIKSLLVLHQDTEWGNGPWDNGSWETYAGLYAEACARIARSCIDFSDKVAYQLFNETDSQFGDDASNTNPSAIPVPPQKYALIVERAAAAIRAVDPDALIVLGGMKTGPQNAVNYLKIVEQTLGKKLPVDAIAFHPYGRFVNHAPFNFGSIGRLNEAIDIFHQAFPDHSLWITEIGVPGHGTVLGPQYYQTIATYMDEVVHEITLNHADTVSALLWFAWSDVSENAGIITRDGQMKDKIAGAYQMMKSLNRAPLESALEALQKNYDAQFVSYASSLENHNTVPAGTQFTSEWTFRNTGARTWDSDCRLLYVPDESVANNDPMVAEMSFELAGAAAPMPGQPGDDVVVTLTLTAPQKFGRVYTSRWELRDPDDKSMGFLYAEITVIPASTAGTPARKPDMAFISDKTVPDGSRFTEGDAFDKQWLVRNTGSRHWGAGFRLVYVDGDKQMARGNVSHLVPPAAPGDEVILSVPMTAPPSSGSRPTVFQSTWRLQDDHGNYFGQPIWVKIVSLPSEAVSTYGRFNDPSGWYSQKDPRWADLQLGHGGQTIASWGCLLTCYAMMLTAYGRPYTPQQLNDRLRDHVPDRGFEGSAVQFVAPTDVLPGIIMRSNFRSRRSPEIPNTYWQEGIDPLKRIDDALASGHVIIAQVDYDRNDAVIDQHWVILLQRTPAGDDYEILDPFVLPDQIASQPLSLMALYGHPNPSRSFDDNLRDAIKSALLYQLPGISGG